MSWCPKGDTRHEIKKAINPYDLWLCSAPGRTRTFNLLIKSQSATPEIPGKKAHSENCAAPGAAVGSENTPIDPDLAAVVDAWPKLPEAIRAGILAMIRAAGGAG